MWSRIWRWAWHWLLFAAAFVLFLLAYSFRSRGGHRLPGRGGVLIVANHQSFLDPMLVGASMRRPLAYLARKSLFRNRFLAWLMDTLGAIPLDRDASPTQGIKAALRLLKAGKAVVMFPEGGRSRDGKLRPLKPGLIALLRRTEVPVIPVGIAGAFDAWPARQRLPRFGPLLAEPSPRTIATVVGPPIDAKKLLALPPDDLLAMLGEILQRLHDEAARLRRKV